MTDDESIKEPQSVAAVLTASIAERAMKAKKVSTGDLPRAIVELYRATLAELQRSPPMSGKGIFGFYRETAKAAKK